MTVYEIQFLSYLSCSNTTSCTYSVDINLGSRIETGESCKLDVNNHAIITSCKLKWYNVIDILFCMKCQYRTENITCYCCYSSSEWFISPATLNWNETIPIFLVQDNEFSMYIESLQLILSYKHFHRKSPSCHLSSVTLSFLRTDTIEDVK